MKPRYQTLAEHYERCLATHGACAKGVDWPNEKDAETRHRVMLEVIREPASLPLHILDLGCGYGALKDYMVVRGMPAGWHYEGIDLSPAMIDAACTRHPEEAFSMRDILAEPLAEQSVDYVVMNGLFTEKLALSEQEMTAFACAMLKNAFGAARRGIAFNVMRPDADWRREDLFYWPFEALGAFLSANISRHFLLRGDYGLYEYTAYVYREPGA